MDANPLVVKLNTFRMVSRLGNQPIDAMSTVIFGYLLCLRIYDSTSDEGVITIPTLQESLSLSLVFRKLLIFIAISIYDNLLIMTMTIMIKASSVL